MAALTDGQIQKAIKRAEKSRKGEILTDGEGRGTGRLVLILKAQPKRVTSVWYAQQWLDGKKASRKIGDYPHIGLAKAREVFERDFAAAISKGSSIKVAGDTRPGTVADLFTAYCDSLEADGKMSHKVIRFQLDKVVAKLGANRLAREIEPDDVVNVLRPIFAKGTRSLADHVRAYIRSAYGWGLKMEHDYRSLAPRRFMLVSNPAAAIPTEPRVRGQRWLREDEWKQLYDWLDNPTRTSHRSYFIALQVLMLTGQRVEEIARLRAENWSEEEGIIDWGKTKNGLPHAIPLPATAVELMKRLKPNKYGWFFPATKDPKQHVGANTLYNVTWRVREEEIIPHCTNRDIRRTWKTLAGKAGLTKEIRDRLQNHIMGDVSSQSYDRYSYMKEKREAMAVWDGFVQEMLRGKKDTPPDLRIVGGTEAA